MRLSPILARLNALEAHLVQSTEEDGLLASSRGSGRNTVPTHSNFDEAARPQARPCSPGPLLGEKPLGSAA